MHEVATRGLGVGLRMSLGAPLFRGYSGSRRTRLQYFNTGTTGAVFLLLACFVSAQEAPRVGPRTSGPAASSSVKDDGLYGQTPVTDTYDWIQLTSDEWIKGEFVAMFREKLEFDSEELDLLSLDWDDVKYVRSARVMQVWFSGNITATGRLLIEDDSVRVFSGDEQYFRRSQILRIASGEPKEFNYWSGTISLGADFRRGNSDQVEGNAKISFLRRTVQNRFSFEYLGNYDKSEKDETANNHRAMIGWDKFITDRFFVIPVVGEYFRDPIQNISHRETLGCGLGYQLIDTAKTDWRLFGGPAYQNTRFENVQEGNDTSESTPALLVGITYDKELSKLVDFNYGYRFLIVSKKGGVYQHHMIAGLEVELGDLPDLDISIIWDQIQNPQKEANGDLPSKEDLRLTLGLAWRF